MITFYNQDETPETPEPETPEKEKEEGADSGEETIPEE